MTGGRALELSTPTSLFDRSGVRFPTWTRAMWQLFAMMAAMLSLADVACRRLINPGTRWFVQRRAPAERASEPGALHTEAAPATAPPTAPVQSRQPVAEVDGTRIDTPSREPDARCRASCGSREILTRSCAEVDRA